MRHLYRCAARLAALPLFLFTLTGFPVTPIQARSVRAAAKPCPSVQCGTAAWHGGNEPTAEGRRWRSADLIAAHRSLPLGAKVRVTNIKNGRQTVVRIADRGPYTRRRIIDLSPAAARQIGMMESGLALVRVEVLPAD